MSNRNFMATHNLIAVSANNKEAAINVAQALDTSMLCAIGNVPNLEPRRESNAEETIGKEEPDAVYDLGSVAAMPLEFEKGQPQHFAFLLAFALGAISTAAAGTGYEHTITPIDGDLDGNRSNPSFTLAARLGKTVLKRRFASMFVDSTTVTFATDDWCKITGALKSTGKVSASVYEETVNALNDATSLTLAANGVEGADAAIRLANVHRIRAETATGVWTEVMCSAVSAATPAVISIDSLEGDGLSSYDYKILYVPTESGWMSFPSRVTETPLRVSQLTLKVGGTWDGSAFQGGRTLSSELKSIEWNLANNLEVQFVPGATGAYATRGIRQGRTQTITLNREMREYILQQHIDDNDTFGLYALAEGAVYDSPHKYQVEIIFPMLSVLKAPISVDGKRLAEAGDLVVLEHDTYGSVIAKVKNLQTTYAA